MNSTGLGFDTIESSTLDLANLSLSHYRTSADLKMADITQPFLSLGLQVDPDEHRNGIA